MEICENGMNRIVGSCEIHPKINDGVARKVRFFVTKAVILV
jgi:hypothetical protein